MFREVLLVRNFVQRILRTRPSVTHDGCVCDLIINNWNVLVTLFVGVGVVGYLASITDSIAAWGPLGLGLVCVFSVLVIWVGLAIAANLRAKASLKYYEARAIKKWQEQVATVNPLLPEFNRQRLNFLHLAHPVTNRISGKRFVDCELLGPANILIINGNCSYMKFINCDVVIVKSGAVIRNAIALEDCTLIGGSMAKCTIFIPQAMRANFVALGANIISVSAEPAASAYTKTQKS
jgi:hypothetical protein